jgi:2'-5' RNA ligase
MSRRLFVSVDLDGLAEGVAAVQELFRDASGLSFTDPEQAHVTLKFLGDTPEDRVADLVAELERAVEDSGVAPFEVEFGGLGVFPSLDYISVVWLGVRGSEATAGSSDGPEGARSGGAELTALHETVEERTVAMGFEAADHEFTPHVTLARMQHAGGTQLVQEVVEERDPDVGTLHVEEVRLTESVLTDAGPLYTTVESFPL